MLRIECPFCGLRDHDEFHYGGDGSGSRPVHGEGGREAWYEYVFVHENPSGPHLEYWQHVLGCRQWLIVERNTATHDILSVKPAREGVA